MRWKKDTLDKEMEYDIVAKPFYMIRNHVKVANIIVR